MISTFFVYSGILYGIYWLCLLIGFIVVRSKTDTGRKLERYTWNSRVDSWHRQPVFKYLFNAMDNRKYVLSSILVMLFNLPMVIFQLLAGLIFLSPLVSAYAGIFVGLLVGQGKGKKFFIYTLITLIFEFSAFALAGGIGMSIGKSWLLTDTGFIDSWESVFGDISWFSILPLICLVLNGVLEATGPLLGIDGVPGIRAYKEKIYK